MFSLQEVPNLIGLFSFEFDVLQPLFCDLFIESGLLSGLIYITVKILKQSEIKIGLFWFTSIL